MPRRTHYQVLGVARDASSIEIANAVRDKLAELKAKPGGSDDEVREAYQVLANRESRAEYDATLPPDAKMLAAQRAAEKGPGAMEFVKDVAKEAGLVKVAIPIAVILAIGVVWLKIRPDSRPAPVIEMTRIAIPKPPERSETKSAATQDASPTLQPVPAASAPPSNREMGAEDVFAAVSASVARIQTFDGSGRMVAQGSGVATGNSIVITNCHVVTGATRLSVKVAGTVLDGVVQVADRQLDLCSLRVDKLAANPVSINTSEVRVGQHVFAIGAPQGLELTLSEGIVSSLRQTTKGTIIQTTAPISPGSSGGGLFDSNGRLVGVVTFQHKTGQNLNFALPASWIFEMQDREATEDVAAPISRTADSPQ